MKASITQITFLKALDEMYESPRKLEKYLKDKRLTRSEKRVVHCWTLLRKCKFKEVILELEKMPDESPLLESQRLFLLGNCFNNLGYYQKAKEHLINCVDVLDELGLGRMLFMSGKCLFVAGCNDLDEAYMSIGLNIIDKTYKEQKDQTAFWHFCHFNYARFTGDTREAEKRMKILDRLYPEQTENFKSNYLVSKLMFFAKNENLEACFEVLNEKKKMRSYKYKANTVYMELMLNYLVYDRPIYAYQRDFLGCDILFYQAKLIQSIHERDEQQIEKFWAKLQNQNPQLFSGYLYYQGEKSLFSLALNKAKISLTKPRFGNLPKDKLKALETILNQLETPIKKKDLFYALWNKEMSSPEDKSKLKNLIYKYRKTHGDELKYDKGTYYLAHTSDMLAS